MYMTGWIAIGSSPSLLDHDHALLDLADAQDADVRLRDDRAADHVALPARVGDREGLAREVVGGELAVARLDRDARRCARAMPRTREFVGVLDDRHDEAFGRVDRDAEVDLARGARTRCRARAR